MGTDMTYFGEGEMGGEGWRIIWGEVDVFWGFW